MNVPAKATELQAIADTSSPLVLNPLDRGGPSADVAVAATTDDLGGRLRPWGTPQTPALAPVISRSLRHNEMLARLRERVEMAGHDIFQPEQRNPDIDLAWCTEMGLVLVEVKSTTQRNEVDQLRRGLSQLLEYAFLLQAAGHIIARKVLYVSSQPVPEHWPELSATQGCELMWDPTTIVDVR
ncbi:hypothetical protein KVF89_25615 [Nocardioides carbamazepini]|uniref:hypothetical protein n=1 Tax=Nocardioides carbamazepini TaxID=2854259 RepID=UPI002149DC66|nr:hypothetical protein [Nocardioides carbamazepini]MCR1785939.1 hypothetical protein [Nocardioides carbamazepini]